MSGKPHLTTEQKKTVKKSILEILEKSPIIEIACKKVGISRMTFYRWRKTDSKFDKQLEEVLHVSRDSINDLAESKMIQAIQNGNNAMIVFWLRNNCDRYRLKPLNKDQEATEDGDDFLDTLPEGSLEISEQNYDDSYPADLCNLSLLSTTAISGIEGVFFVPYQGNNQEASILWGIKQIDEILVYQGVIWQGNAENFKVDEFFSKIRSQLDKIYSKVRNSWHSTMHMIFYGDEQNSFSKMVCEYDFNFRNYTMTCVTRNQHSILKRILLKEFEMNKVFLRTEFAITIKEELLSDTKQSQDLIRQFAIPLMGSQRNKIMISIAR